MKVIVTGGRNFENHSIMADVMNYLRPSQIIHGGCSGADRLADGWATSNGIPATEFAADWIKYGRVAGPIRNAHMLDSHPDALVVAFPGGKGTENCIKQAKERKMLVLRVESL